GEDADAEPGRRALGADAPALGEPRGGDRGERAGDGGGLEDVDGLPAEGGGVAREGDVERAAEVGAGGGDAAGELGAGDLDAERAGGGEGAVHLERAAGR